MKRSPGWRPALGSTWERIDPVTGELQKVKVSSRFPTTEGQWVSLRDPETGAPLGNCAATELREVGR
jgi:hypothetical protein